MIFWNQINISKKHVFCSILFESKPTKHSPQIIPQSLIMVGGRRVITKKLKVTTIQCWREDEEYVFHPLPNDFAGKKKQKDKKDWEKVKKLTFYVWLLFLHYVRTLTFHPSFFKKKWVCTVALTLALSRSSFWTPLKPDRLRKIVRLFLNSKDEENNYLNIVIYVMQ